MIIVPDIAMNMDDLVPEADRFKQIGSSGRLQGIADHFRPQLQKPEGKPGTFEAGMAGNENAPGLVSVFKHFRGIQGASLPHLPPGLALSPEAIQVIHVSLVIHTGPEALVPVHHEFTFA